MLHHPPLYKNIGVAWTNVLLSLLHQPKSGSRNGEMREIISPAFAISGGPGLPNHTVRKISQKYAAAEALWYLAGSDNGEWMEIFAPQYRNFLYDNGVAGGAYGPRIKNGIFGAISALVTRHQTRQAVIPILDANDTQHYENTDYPDIPCTQGLQFFIRNGLLHMVVTMRSNDAWLGLPYDFFCFAIVQESMRCHLRERDVHVACGDIHWRAGSLHLYEKNAEKARRIVEGDVNVEFIPFEIRHDNIGYVSEQWIDDNVKTHRAQGEFTPPPFSVYSLVHDLYEWLT